MEPDKGPKLYSRKQFLELLGIGVASVVLLPSCDTNTTLADLQNTQDADKHRNAKSTPTLFFTPQPTNTVQTGPQPDAGDEFVRKNLLAVIIGMFALVGSIIGGAILHDARRAENARNKHN